MRPPESRGGEKYKTLHPYRDRLGWEASVADWLEHEDGDFAVGA